MDWNRQVREAPPWNGKSLVGNIKLVFQLENPSSNNKAIRPGLRHLVLSMFPNGFAHSDSVRDMIVTQDVGLKDNRRKWKLETVTTSSHTMSTALEFDPLANERTIETTQRDSDPLCRSEKGIEARPHWSKEPTYCSGDCFDYEYERDISVNTELLSLEDTDQKTVALVEHVGDLLWDRNLSFTPYATLQSMRGSLSYLSVFDGTSAPSVCLTQFLSRLVSYLNKWHQLQSKSPVSEPNGKAELKKKEELNIGLRAIVMSLVYLNRMTRENSLVLGDSAMQGQCGQYYSRPVQITRQNIHRLFAAGMLVSTKFLEDRFFANSFWAKVCGISLKELNQLEISFTKALSFDLYVSSTEFKNTLLSLKSATQTRPKPSSFYKPSAKRMDRTQYQHLPQPRSILATQPKKTQKCENIKVDLSCFRYSQVSNC